MDQSLDPQPEQTLAQWIKANVPGGQSAFARRLRVSKGHLSNVLRGLKGMSADLQARIEIETEGAFTGARLHRERAALNGVPSRGAAP